MLGSLVEMFTGNIFQRLLAPSDLENRHDPHLDDDAAMDALSDGALEISTIGPLLWSEEYFVSNLSRSSSFDGDDENDDDSQNNFDERRNVSDLSNVILGDNSLRTKRKLAPVRMTASQVCQELSKANVSPHLLIAPHAYGESFGAGAGASQPFKITVHPQVGFLSDLHGHLCDAEVIGLLAGKWDGESKILYVQASFPCTSTERREDDGSTDVELDPVAELAVREVISSLGLIVVGWYHSHPQFRPDPSVTDINNQQQYQTLMKDEETGLEPFIGLIVSTFDPKLPSLESHHQWFYTRPYFDGARGKKPVAMPMLLKVDIGVFCEDHCGLDAFLGEAQTAALLDKLLSLEPEGPAGAVSGATSTGSASLSDSSSCCETNPRGLGDDKYEHATDAVGSDDIDEPLVLKLCRKRGATAKVAAQYNYAGLYTSNEEFPHSAAPSVVADAVRSETPVLPSSRAPTEDLFYFNGSGGPKSLENGTSSAEAEVGGKRKYTKKPIVPVNLDISDRRSGREIKARDIYVPEKEKKVPVKSSVPAAESKTPAVSIKANPHIAPLKTVNTKKKVLPPTSLSSKGSDLSRGGLGSKAVSGKAKGMTGHKEAMDKWIKAGAVLVTAPVPAATPGHGSLKGVVKRHGPGARGSKSLFQSAASNRSSSSSSSVKEEDVDHMNVPVVKKNAELRMKKELPKGKPSKLGVPQLVPSALSLKSIDSSVELSKEGMKRKRVLNPNKIRLKRGAEYDDTSCDTHCHSQSSAMQVTSTPSNTASALSLLEMLQYHSEAALRGRRLICSVKPMHRCLVLGIVTLGFYYAAYPRRMDLLDVWKDDIVKIDKLKGSISVWAARLNVSLSSQKILIDDIVSFLRACWLEGCGKIVETETNKKVGKKRNLGHSHTGGEITSSHVSKDGRVVIYKEDNGRDDEPKKKKKKKIMKK